MKIRTTNIIILGVAALASLAIFSIPRKAPKPDPAMEPFIKITFGRAGDHFDLKYIPEEPNVGDVFDFVVSRKDGCAIGY